MLESDFKKEFLERMATRLRRFNIDIVDVVGSRSMPDKILLGPGVWAALEFKRDRNAPHRPNQDYHISRLNEKGFARFVYPENGDIVLNELERLFEHGSATQHSKRRITIQESKPKDKEWSLE